MKKIVYLIVLIALFASCKKDKQTEALKMPTVITKSATEITISSAHVGGIVDDYGTGEGFECGICWGTSPNPTVNGNAEIGYPSGDDHFEIYLTGLLMNTTYYVRAYATNSVGTAYGTQITFKTLSLPTVTTQRISGISYNTATCGGNVTYTGGQIIEKGVCWSESPTPTIDYSKTSNGSGTGAFTSNINKLMPNTTYYVRAFATYDEGTEYGNEVSFTSAAASWGIIGTSTSGGWDMDENMIYNPDDDTWSINLYLAAGEIKFRLNDTWEINYGGGNNILVPGGANIPVTSAGSYTITINISSLTYSITINGSVPSVTLSPITQVTSTSAKSGGTASSITEIYFRGVCWSTNPNPTVSDSKTEDGSGSGSFTSTLTGLSESTTYHVRAYAVNWDGLNYSQERTFTTTPTGGQTGTVTDIDGNTYNTVVIGNQTWMAENLRTKKLNNGTAIPLVTSNDYWKYSDPTNYVDRKTSAYCYYDNNSNYIATYGLLYNWYAVNTGHLCPAGWHVPTDSDWVTLENYLGNGESEGPKMRVPGAWYGNSNLDNNSSGFSALPGGQRTYWGSFGQIQKDAYWWSSTVLTTPTGWASFIDLGYNTGLVLAGDDQRYGKSVRCVKN